MHCPACGGQHDAAGAPWCSGADAAPGPGPYGGDGPVPLQVPGRPQRGPDPGDMELFIDTAPLPVVTHAAAESDGAWDDPGAEARPPGHRRRIRHRRRRRRRLAAVVTAGAAALAGTLFTANYLGDVGSGRDTSADERPDLPEEPLPSDGSASPDSPRAGERTGVRAAPADRFERQPPLPPSSAPDRGDGTAARSGVRPGSTAGSPSRSASTATADASIISPSGSNSGATATPTSPSPSPTPTQSDDPGDGDGDDRDRPRHRRPPGRRG